MEIIRETVLIKDLVDGYVDESEFDIENGVYAYGGKLCVRPKFQRSFIYTPTKENAVIDTTLKGFPLNIMYWADNEDGTYDCLDGQQRTLSLCHFVDGTKDFSAPWFYEGRKTPINALKRIDPDRYDRFMNYPLEVYICKGDKKERMEWFRTINIAGAELTNQELRNANYVSEWLTAAKKYFSKANPSSTAACPAERVGGKYTKKNANRQELLEQVIAWRMNTDVKDDDAICQYMNDHLEDKDASDLINYFNNVISWIEDIFVNYDSHMSSINWGKLYNEHCNDDLDPDEVAETFDRLLELHASKALDVSVGKIIEYCITKDESLLKSRAFTDTQRTVLYNKQKGICPECHRYFEKNEMHAHHKIPWFNGGLTEIDNGIMLCKECHERIHAETHFSL